MKNVLYFHGFASSPHGTKVDRLRERLEPRGFRITAPDLNAPSFRKLDFDAMVAVARDAARTTAPDVIVGSSLGSLVALSVARTCAGAPIVLIAPAFAIGDRWLTKLPEGDPIRVFHYGAEGETEIHRRFFEQMSAVTVDEQPPPSPVTVLMGRLDESIPFELVHDRWNEWIASGRLVEGSELIEIPDGDHRLLDSSDRIAEIIRRSAGA